MLSVHAISQLTYSASAVMSTRGAVDMPEQQGQTWATKSLRFASIHLPNHSRVVEEADGNERASKEPEHQRDDLRR
jgi:hypothetical protein